MRESVVPVILASLCFFSVQPVPAQIPKIEDTNTSGVVITEIMYHPASGDADEEYVELYNRGEVSIDLSGWRFTDGVDYTFPGVALDAGAYLVVAASSPVFSALYPTVSNVVGGWEGRLGNNGETLELSNSAGFLIDWVRYADEGDWSIRELGPEDRTFRGWIWRDDHDGEGKSLELLNASMPNAYGQNWAPSVPDGGTPGAQNSVATTDAPPLILEVAHSPLIPRPTDSVVVGAVIMDETSTGLAAILRYRVDGDPTFSSTPMSPQGNNLYVGSIDPPPAPEGDKTIIEFYLEAFDTGGNYRSYPAPSWVDGATQQVTNLLFQYDSSFDPDRVWIPGSQPIYTLIMTEIERAILEDIGDGPKATALTKAQMNGVFIGIDGVDAKLRYNVGIRNRGKGSSDDPPNNYRVNFRHDRPWKDVTAINLNSKYTYRQLLGMKLFALAGLPAVNGTASRVRVNGQDLSGFTQFEMYNTYAHLQVQDSDFADDKFPGDGAGNLYNGLSDSKSTDLSYLGTDPQDYRDAGYSKETNTDDDDWTDLINLTFVLNNTPDVDYVEAVEQVANVDQWLKWFALQAIFSNQETNLGNGRGDDYYMYRGVDDPRFVLLPHDLDEILDLADIDDSILRATQIDALDRFLTHPVFAQRYYATFLELVETLLTPQRLDFWVDEILDGFVPQSKLDDIKQFFVERNAKVLEQIPLDFSIQTSLPITNGFPATSVSVISLNGTANAAETGSVFVNGGSATWAPIDGEWSSDGIQLNPGINRIRVQTFLTLDGSGVPLHEDFIDIWYNNGMEQTISGTLGADTVFSTTSGVWRVTGDLVVPAGLTLTIRPGTTVFFEGGAGLRVNGRLIAEGTEFAHIRLTRVPGGARWDGIFFDGTGEENRISFADIEYGDAQGEAFTITDSKLFLDHVEWDAANETILELDGSSVAVTNSVFPNMQGDEPVHGSGLPPDGFLIFEGNRFGTTTGSKDILDFSGGQRPDAIVQVINNVFLGGGDDGLDLDGADAHIEGNLFMNFHQDAPRASSSNAIATGRSGGNAAEITVARNTFIDNDHDILLKEGSSLSAANNFFLGASIGSLSFGEPNRGVAPGAGAEVEGGIFRDMASLFSHPFAEPGETDPVITIDRSVIPAEAHSLGADNTDEDPRILYSFDNGNVELRPGSPAFGNGPGGLDMGANVPAGASISGEPVFLTHRTTATLAIGGPGITHYKYRLNGDAWSQERSIDQSVELSGLGNGTYTLYAIGKNSAGVWQSEGEATVSKTWTVDSALERLLINEVLASNETAERMGGDAPDLIELYNAGGVLIDLAGMSVSDRSIDPLKFVFPAGTSLQPGEYLVLIAEDVTSFEGLHLGFSLKRRGEGVFLYQPLSQGGALIDSVEFGLQVTDLSIGRVGHEQEWTLTHPTFGFANTPARLGDPSGLRINEWLADADLVANNDFVEIFNPDPYSIDIGGFFLTDDPVARPDRNRISPLSFVPGMGFAVFIADSDPEDGPHHTNFRLSPNLEMIGLYNADRAVIDVVLYGPQTTDVSQGRLGDGVDHLEFFYSPSPENANIESPVPPTPTPSPVFVDHWILY